MADDDTPLHRMPGDGGSRPIPDPTKLTQDLVRQAMDAEKERVEGLLEVLRSRLDGMDLATNLRLKEIDHVPRLVDEKVRSAGAVVDVRFMAVDEQFNALKERMAEQKTDTQSAVTAAFAASDRAVSLQTEASEKSISKSEASTTKQIDSNAAQFTAAIEGIKEQLTEVKLSVERITAAKIGGVDQRSEMRDRSAANGLWIGIAVSVFVAVVAVVGAIATIVTANGG